MKKFGLFAALATLVTVGGVYATWSYANGAVTASDPVSTGVTITGSDTTTTPNGHVEMTVNNFELKVENDGNYNTALYWETSGDKAVSSAKIDLLYNLNDNTSLSTDKITVTLTLDFGDAGDDDSVTGNSYKSTTIFTGGTTSAIELTDGVKQTVDLKTYISCAKINLPTKTDYDNFAAVLNDTELTITVNVNQPIA